MVFSHETQNTKYKTLSPTTRTNLLIPAHALPCLFDDHGRAAVGTVVVAGELAAVIDFPLAGGAEVLLGKQFESFRGDLRTAVRAGLASTPAIIVRIDGFRVETRFAAARAADVWLLDPRQFEQQSDIRLLFALEHAKPPQLAIEFGDGAIFLPGAVGTKPTDDGA